MRAHLDLLMLLSFVSAVGTLVCWNLTAHSLKPARLMLAGCLAAQALCGFLSGAWPLGMIAIVASVMAARWWWNERSVNASKMMRPHRAIFSQRAAVDMESRMSRLFDSGAN